MDYKSLKSLVLHHDKLYYDEHNPILEDSEYDNLFDQLVEMEKMQGWRDADSPTIRITAAAGKVKHPHPLYSLKKVYDESEIDERFSVVTPKLDGVNLSVTYQRGQLHLLLTRGDGETGESVMHLSRVIAGIPLTCYSGATFVGEVVTDNSVDNFRNYVAGALGLKSAREAKDRNLRFIVHDVLGVEDNYLNRLELAYRHGFNTVLTARVDQYPQDGLVYRVNEYEQERLLGYTAKHPRFAVALKRREDFSAATTLLDIDWTIGRSGVVTPVGVVEPVVLDGATINRVILHNFDYVQQHELRPGDTVLIERRITPQFVRVLEHSLYSPFSIEDVQASVGCELRKIGPRLYVSEADSYRLVEHFVKQMGFKGIGPATIRKLNIQHPIQLFNRSDWNTLGKVGENIRTELSRPKDYVTILSSLGIPGVGKTTAKLIVSHISSFKNLLDIEHMHIDKIGDKTKEKIVSWYLTNYEWVEQLPYTLEQTVEQVASDNRVLVLSGKFDMKKSELEEHLSRHGFQFSGSVSKKTYAVISAGTESTKTRKAESLGIPVIDYYNNKKQILKGLI